VRIKELYTWKDYRREDDLKNFDWNKLRNCVNFIRKLQEKLPVEDLIEESPPVINDDVFNPGGWIGIYKVGDDFIKVVPDPETITPDEFESIKKELIGWLEYIGPFLEHFLARYMNESLFRWLLYTMYSRRLVELTEILLSHFVPRNISSREYVGRELRGRPDWKKTILLKTKNYQSLVSRKVEFTLKTLSNLLLTRFHAELLGDMTHLLNKIDENDLPEFLGNWRINKAYHEEFISMGILANFFEESLYENFESFETLEKIRRKAKEEMIEIADLWEAYISNKTFFADFGNRFDTALKPLSKIYELWCFKKLCDILKIDGKRIKAFPCRVTLKLRGKKVKLNYNTTKGLRKYSGIMKHIPVQLGRPDFVLESSERIACVMDAKCKKRLDQEDIHRFLSYLLDYMCSTQEAFVGLIFHISRKKSIKSIRVKKGAIHLVPMTPTSYPYVKEDIRSIIEQTLST